jgi:hypothetical protein
VSAVAILSNLDEALRRMKAAVEDISRVLNESATLAESSTAMLWHLILRLPSELVNSKAD